MSDDIIKEYSRDEDISDYTDEDIEVAVNKGINKITANIVRRAIQANQVVATTCLQDLLDPPTAHSSAQGPGLWHTGRMDLAQTQALPKRRKVTNSQAD